MLGTGLGVYIPIALYIVAALTCILSLVWRPVLGLYLLILVMPQQRLRYRIDDWPAGGHIIVILLVCVIVGAMLKAKFPQKSSLNKVLFFLVGYTFICVLLGIMFVPNAPFLSRLVQWKDYMVLPALFFATTAVIRTKKDLALTLVVLCFSAFMVHRSFALEVRTRNFSQFNEDARDVGPLGLGSNHTAAFEAQTAVCLFALLASQKRLRNKLILYFVFAVNLYCVLFAFSRAAYLGFFVSMFFLMLMRHRKWIPVLVLVAVGWQVVLPTAVIQRITMTHSNDGELDNSAAMRLVLWNDAVNLYVSNPVTGWGYATYQYMNRVGHLKDTHNYYMKAIVETGTIGIVLILSIIWKFFRMSWTLYRRATDPLLNSLGLGMAACTICIFIVNFFGDRWTFVEINGIVWVAFGLVAVGNNLLDQPAEEAAPAEKVEMETPGYLQPAYR